MRALRITIVFVLAAVLGFSVDFIIRRQGKPAGEVVRSFAPPTSSQRTHPTKGESTSFGDSMRTVSVPDKLERDLAIAIGVSRWLYWLEAIEKARVEDMPQLAGLAAENQAAIRLLAARWIELDPKHLFNFLLGQRESSKIGGWALENMLVSEWSKKDPHGIIKALDEAPPFGARSVWRNSIAGKIMEKDPELGLKLMAQWHIENFSPSSAGVAKWSARDPQHAAEFILGASASIVSREVAKTVGAEWAKVDPVAALNFAAKQTSDVGSLLAGSALQSWARQDLKAATEWLESAERSARNRLSRSVVEVWAEKDPAAALIWSENNLTGSSLSGAVSGVLKAAAEKDVSSAGRLVGMMQPSSARTAAALSVAEKWLPGLSGDINGTSGSKPEAIQWLSSLDPDSIKSILERFSSSWSQTQPRSLAEFLQRTPVEHIPAHIYATLARNFARQDPRGAIEWAAGTPEYARAEAGGDAFAEWHRAQPEAALDWWSHLQANDPQRKACFEAAVRNLAWDSQATEQFGALAALDPASARGVLEKMGLGPDRRDRLLRAMAARQ